MPDLKRTADYQPFLVIAGENAPTVRWTDDRRLRVQLPAGVQVFHKAYKAGNITITYD